MAEHGRLMNFHSSILQVASIIKNNEQKKTDDSFEMEKKKRERQANYTQEEVDRLVDVCITKKSILENKKNGADQWQEKKQAWDEIERAFNKENKAADTSKYRDSKTLRVKYESIKKDVKRKWNDILAGRKNSNGKIPKLTAAEKKIKEIMRMPVEDGYCDFSSVNKSDDDDDSNASRTSDKTKEQDWASQSVKKEITQSDDDDDDDDEEPNNIKTEFVPLNIEPPRKKICRDPLVGQSGLDKKDEIGKNLREEKLETVIMQKDLLEQEILEKKLKIKMIQEKMEQNRALFELQKKKLVMEIEALKNGRMSNVRDINDITDL